MRRKPWSDMYSRSSEPVRFERDCPAVLVPQGDAVTLPAGTAGYITQALGGSYTDVELVFDPPWTRHMMSEAARLETGML